MGGISIWQLLIITVIVVLLFDTKKLGSIGSDLGASIEGFKKAMSDDEPKQSKTSQNVDFTARTIADKQADTNQEQAKTEGAERHDKEQVQSVFDIGFSELLLASIIGLVVLGPQRLSMAVKTVTSWTRALCSLATAMQNELTQELRLQGFQDSLEKVEEASLTNLTPELKASMNELRQATESMKRSYVANDPEEVSDETHTVHNPVMKDNRTVCEGVTPAAAQAQTSSPEQKPETTPESVVKPTTGIEPRTTIPSPLSGDKP